MKILFIITGSIAVSKCFEILDELKKNKVKVNCIITNNALKLLNINKLKKRIFGKIIDCCATNAIKCSLIA